MNLNIVFYIIPLLCLISQVFSTVNTKVTSSETEVLTENNKYSHSSSENNHTKSEWNSKSSEYDINNGKVESSVWFLNIPLLPVVVATSNSIPEGSCKRQLQLYLNHLKNGTLWATEMFDSSAKYPYGVFDGLTRHLGSFDQCYRIHTIVQSKENGIIEEIRSRYCLVDIKYQKKDEPSSFTGKFDIWFDLHGSAWEAIREKGDLRRYQRYQLQMALCVPATCYPEDIVSALKEPLDKFSKQYNLKVQTSIQNDMCAAVHETKEFSIYAVAYCFVFLFIMSLVLISTILDNDLNEDYEHDIKKKLLFCFSARRSFNSIFRINYHHRGLDCIHMIRFLFSSIVIIGHRQVQVLHGPNITARHCEWSMTIHELSMIIHNATIIVDGFFGLGGLILSYQLLEFCEKSPQMNIVLMIVKRFLRITPPYMFVIFGYATLFHHLGSGPLWENRLGFDRDSCSTYWWANLLFINNYVSGKYTCMFQSWYLAVDFQCYIIGLFLTVIFQKMPRKFGYAFLGSVLIISTAIPFYVTYKYDIDPLFKALGNRRRMEDYDYFQNYYVKTHMRLAAYTVGIIVGAIVYDYKFATWRLSKTWSRILFILQVVILSIYTEHLGIYFIDPNYNPSFFLKALYASLHRPIFAFSMCSIVLLITIGDGLDFHYNFLAPKWVQPLSRLSYGIFLLHFVIQSYELGIARTAFTFSFYNLVKFWTLDFIYAIVLSLFLTVIIEEPFKNLGNLLFTGFYSRKPVISPETVKKVN